MLWGLYDAVILDLDGVVYIGEHPVNHAIDSLQSIASTVHLTAATNNASRTAEDVAEHLQELGLNLQPSDVVTSAQAGARLLSTLVPEHSRILAVGGHGVEEALHEVGLRPLRATRDHVANHTIAAEVVGVLQGHGVDTSWWDLSTASWALARGAAWVATNRDLTVPTPYGLGPGNGSLVSALEKVVEFSPLVAGKPEPTLFLETAARIGSKRPLVIGDRLDTDIDGAAAAGMDSLLVLTGVHSWKHAVERAGNLPTYVAEDLRCLVEPAGPRPPSLD
jgi:HAD superfamily hydrolase (TIGR01450 family)